MKIEHLSNQKTPENTPLVFDVSLYKDLPQETRKRTMQEDLAGLVIEAGNSELEKRINPRKFKIVKTQVIEENKDGEQKNVLKGLKFETELNKKESKAAISFYEHLLSFDNSISISISPSGGDGNYKEGRVNVGFRKQNEIEFYGIPTHLSPDHLMQRSIAISNLTLNKTTVFSPEDLREISIPIILNEDDDPIEFLQEIFPLDSNAWEVIDNKDPWEIKEEALKDAKKPSENGARMINKNTHAYQFINIGAQMEMEMKLKGWELKSSACPGQLNSQIKNSVNSTVDSFGNTRIAVSWEYHSGNCINCGARNVPVGPCSICKSCEKVL